jgi:DNA polymerase-1
MDTLQLVRDDTVTVYTLKKGINDTIMYNEDAVVARYGFAPQRVPDFKGLKGDPSDNIPGVPGVGETTAQKLVATYGDLDAIFAALDADVDAVHKKTGIQKRFLTKIIEGKEDAEFSKMLATIKTDVPIDFVLPTQSWKEGIDVPALKALFAELEFRSLGARVDELVNGKTHIHNSATDTAPPKKVEHTLEDADTTAETQLMLWLVRSDYTNPTLDDVFAHTKTHAVAQAHKVLEGEIQKHGLQDVYEHIEKPLRPIVEAMQHYGVLLDVAYLKKLSKTYHAELAAIEKRIFKHAGGQFNINSPKQLGDILFDTLAIVPAGVRTKKTATGQRSTKESELQKHAKN